MMPPRQAGFTPLELSPGQADDHTGGRRPAVVALALALAATAAVCAASFAGAFAGAAAADRSGSGQAGAPTPVRAVVVTFWGPERAAWQAGLPLGPPLESVRGLPYAAEVRLDSAGAGVLSLYTGTGGNAGAAAAVAALGAHSGRFDLSQAFWVLAGVAGIDPAAGAVGSVAVATFVVSDRAYAVDPREVGAPAPGGFLAPRESDLARDASVACVAPVTDGTYCRRGVYELDRALAERVAGIGTALPPLEGAAAALRDRYHPGREPEVIVGDNLSSDEYWAGELKLAWAREWVRAATGGRATFATSAMNDGGAAEALRGLHNAGLTDARRAVFLRAASDYVTPPPGDQNATAVGLLRSEDHYAALDAALRNVYTVGRAALDVLLDDAAA